MLIIIQNANAHSNAYYNTFTNTNSSQIENPRSGDLGGFHPPQILWTGRESIADGNSRDYPTRLFSHRDSALSKARSNRIELRVYNWVWVCKNHLKINRSISRSNAERLLSCKLFL